MELRQLTYFIAVAEERHFGRAAKRLHIAQPPLSQQIRQFEEQLGAKLFDRTTRRVDLTAAGALMLERGRSILNDVEALQADVYQVGQGATGVLHVGFSGASTYSVMPRIVRAAGTAYPGLTLDLHGEMLTPAMERGLLEHTLDAAILRPPVSSPEIDFRIINREPLVVALPAHSPLASDRPLSMVELTEQRFVTYPPESVMYRMTADLCREAGFQHRVSQMAQETSTILSFVAAGGGVALMPASVRSVQLRGVRYRELEDSPHAELAVAWRREDRSVLLSNFIQLVTELADEPESEDQPGPDPIERPMP
ncbi:LysR family transcriptional regulator [Kocuria palustris]|jgi:DNA-binding transcriptional LysR family regulator|uniref:LysR family transcriptional regulator n=1 Tax=Kocuria palustris TaxID=71999 RepID=UPI0006AA3AD8|nr:LysR family transcriptional regulator [Kocuria palustris]ALB03867.1 LysR family transcriptional regulator [Kocuria palustris]KUG56470.1 LysR family transcriptional regulator [Kocuria palustris]MBN6754021.1 LysR family transcriptional regulator [Kocuria palustris]MBN6759140.1 LysR family transcriptional regulator [Kocuria palustris]MBN6763388.1 LysR family transcriptional regulator [Kocuria palustris]